MERLPSHGPLAWREKNIRKQLHLSDSETLRVGRAVVKCFMAIYGLHTGWRVTPYVNETLWISISGAEPNCYT